MFKRLCSAKEALELLLDRCTPLERTERLPLPEAAGRVLCGDLLSSVDLPSFNRAAMDGFAVRAAETRGASPSAPVYLQKFLPLRTGMAVPEGFDAVVMLEDSSLRGTILEVTAPVHLFRNVARIGEDISKCDAVFKEGHSLRPPDIALLAALGLEAVEVFALPKIAIIPTGSELVVPGSRSLRPGEAYESNGLMAQLYVERWGGLPLKQKTVQDDPGLIREALESNQDADMIVIIGGTSVGEKDYAPRVLAEAGQLLVHGVRVQPGKPTALGAVGGTPVVCLPGYPVAALSGLYLFVRPSLKKLAHLSDSTPKTRARLSGKIASRPGYLSIVRVALKGGEAEPIMTSGAGILSSVARADGFVFVPEEREGMEAGEMVEVVMIE
jgi:molybdopterin molybdotransferase